MIEKIISGGQTGADQGALDAAIKLGIPHGGWIPKDRITENGPLPDRYDLIEMPTASYPERTKKNIRESDGTLILSHGRLTGGSEYTRKSALKYGKPMLHIDLYSVAPFDAAVLINDWIVDYDIKTMNVAGPRASKDSKIYQSTLDIIESVLFLCFSENNFMHTAREWDDREHPSDLPKTVDEAATDIIAGMDLRDRTMLANLSEDDLMPLQLTLGLYIDQQLQVWSVNEPLKEACIQACEEEGLDVSNPAMVIIKKVWERLKGTHRLRVVE
jgi:putative molybdenum carrier protein